MRGRSVTTTRAGKCRMSVGTAGSAGRDPGAGGHSVAAGGSYASCGRSSAVRMHRSTARRRLQSVRPRAARPTAWRQLAREAQNVRADSSDGRRGPANPIGDPAPSSRIGAKAVIATNDGNSATCRRRAWSKCPHPWHFNFKLRGGRPGPACSSRRRAARLTYGEQDRGGGRGRAEPDCNPCGHIRSGLGASGNAGAGHVGRDPRCVHADDHRARLAGERQGELGRTTESGWPRCASIACSTLAVVRTSTLPSRHWIPPGDRREHRSRPGSSN